MPLTQNSDRAAWRVFAWSAFWSSILTAFVRWMIAAGNPCFRILNSDEWVWTITGVIWIWLLLFLFFASNRSRLVLLASTVAIQVFTPNADRFRNAAGESAVVGHLRNLTGQMESYRKAHPQEGYPSRLPQISSSSHTAEAERLYEFELQFVHSKPDGPADGYLVLATPRSRECGYIRSFTASQDGRIHFTSEFRPATASDVALQ